jgi:hypothetical protein
VNRLAPRWDAWTGLLANAAILVGYLGVFGSIAVGIELGTPVRFCEPAFAGVPAVGCTQLPAPSPGRHPLAEAAPDIAMLAALCLALILFVLACVSARWKELATSQSSAPWQALSAGPMGLLAALMYPGRGELWLSEVLSSLSECSPRQQSAIIRSYRETAWAVIVRSWAQAVLDMARRGQAG